MRFLTTSCFLAAAFVSFVATAQADILLENTNVYSPASLSFDQLADPGWVTGSFFQVGQDAQISNMSAIFGTGIAGIGGKGGKGGYELGIYEVIGTAAVLIPQSVVQVRIPTWDQVFSGDVQSPDFFDTWATEADYSGNNIMLSADTQYIFGIVSPASEFSVGALAHVGHPITNNGSPLTRITADGIVDFPDQYLISQSLLRIDGSFTLGVGRNGIHGGTAIPEPGSALILISLVGYLAMGRRR